MTPRDEEDFRRFKKQRLKLQRVRDRIRRSKNREGSMSKRRMVREPVAAVPPPGWRLIAARSFSTGTKVFSRGCEISAADLGRNFQSFLDNRFVQWVPPDVKVTATARDRPPAVPAEPSGNPKIEIVHDPDPVLSWRATKRRMVELCGGNADRAQLLLEMDDHASQLYRTALRTAWTKEKRERGLMLLSPNQMLEPL